MAVVAVGLAIAGPVEHVVGEAIRVAAEVIKITAIVLACTAAGGVLGGLVMLGSRIRRHLPTRSRRAAVIQLQPRKPTADAAVQELAVSPARELSARQGYPQLHSVTAEDMAALDAGQDEGDQPCR